MKVIVCLLLIYTLGSNTEFVSVKISKLLKSCVLIEVDATDLLVCNPLGSTGSGSTGLLWINQHFRSCKFKYKDVYTAADLFQQGD